jgi:hypothetical protein
MLKARKGLVIPLLLTQSMNQCMMRMRRLGWDKGLTVSLCRSRLLLTSPEQAAVT